MASNNIRIKVELRGIQQFSSGLAKELDNNRKQAGYALLAEARDIMTKSIPQVPAETGTLRDANFVEGPFEDADEVRVRLGYGGPGDKRNPKTGQMASQYAVIVHERLGADHPSGNAKFLEKPIIEASASMESRVGSRMQQP